MIDRIDTGLDEWMDQLPPVPRVVSELLAIFACDDVSPALIANKVGSDPSLTVRVLKMANSSYFGNRSKVSSVSDAVVSLGTSTIKSIVLSASLPGSVPPSPYVRTEAFWERAFLVACSARWIAKRGGGVLNYETAFTAGLLHAIGQPVLHRAAPHLHESIMEAIRVGEAPLVAIERLAGSESARIGGAMALKWRLPRDLIEAIESQNNPESSSVYGAVVGSAKRVCDHGVQSLDRERLSRAGISADKLLSRCEDNEGIDIVDLGDWA
ncbi:MAG: hypothetical protein DDT25_00016 [Chloroflexi bacterium]|nr:hypothetical protein [Chloroflexota bacterium]